MTVVGEKCSEQAILSASENISRLEEENRALQEKVNSYAKQNLPDLKVFVNPFMLNAMNQKTLSRYQKVYSDFQKEYRSIPDVSSMTPMDVEGLWEKCLKKMTI